MRHELLHSVEVQNATVDTVLPGVIGQLNSMEQAVRQNTEEGKDGRRELEEKIENLEEKIPKMIEQSTLATWHSLFSGITTMVGDMQVATPAGATAPLRASQQQTTVSLGANPVLSARIGSFAFESQHHTLNGLWDEWHGTGNYQDQPIAGGVAALEEKYGSKWRKNKRNMQQRVSRQGRICLGIRKKADAESKSVDSVCNEWNQKYALEFNKNMRRFVQYLQEENLVPVQARRGRRSDT